MSHLTVLFERAKFSPHLIDLAMKKKRRSGLRVRLRDELVQKRGAGPRGGMRSLAVTGTIAFLIAFAARPGDRGIAVRAYVLFLAALALVLLARRLGTSRAVAATSPIAGALRPQPERVERPAELVRMERAVGLGASHAGDYYARLRPVLREVATALLARHGVALDGSPERARGAARRPGLRARAARRAAPGAAVRPRRPAADLRAAVEALERLAE